VDLISVLDISIATTLVIHLLLVEGKYAISCRWEAFPGECLEVVLQALPHAVETLKGRAGECGSAETWIQNSPESGDAERYASGHNISIASKASRGIIEMLKADAVPIKCS
jgi:hypothetical protein